MTLPRYVEYGALATAPGPLVCDLARIYCFFVQADRDRVQTLCDRVLSEPTGGSLRYIVPRAAPVVLTFGVLGGLRSEHPLHAGRGSAVEPEAAIWVPTIAQRSGVSDHLAVFMPYIWVDDPIAFAAGREVYGFAKTQGWMRPLGDPRSAGSADPPDELFLDVYGTPQYSRSVTLGRQRLLTVRRAQATRGGLDFGDGSSEGSDLASLVAHFRPSLDPDASLPADELPRRSMTQHVAGAVAVGKALVGLISEQVVGHVFLKQFRDAADGGAAVLQQVVEARSRVTPESLRWRRLRGSYELEVESLDSQPLQEELGIEPSQQIRHAFVTEFGFTMEPGQVVWPAQAS